MVDAGFWLDMVEATVFTSKDDCNKYSTCPLRTLEEIRAGILALERETEGLLQEIVGV